ncbi:hypothetical protein ACWDUH_10855 [Micromonospora wenchangensis]
MAHTGKRRVTIEGVPQRVWREDGLPFGLLTRHINGDPQTGAQTLVVDVPPGWSMPAHWNTADLELLVRAGDLTVAGRQCRPGHHLFLPSGTGLGPISSEGGASLIFWSDSRFEVRTGEPPTPAKPLSETVDVFDPANWSPVQEAFAGVTDTSSHGDLEVPTQCIRLRRVEDTGKDTILFVLPRRFAKTALEFHHSTEEIFFLGGWCATDPEHVYHAGEYLCWEPGVIHGVVSGWEAICLSKHHGPLTSPQIPLGATSVDAER